MSNKQFAATTILHGLRAFQSHLQFNRSRSILIVQSNPSSQHPSSRVVADACQHVSFLIQQQLGFRAFVSHVDTEVPVRNSIQQQLDLQVRMGADTVVAVGSGCAMDVVKAMETTNSKILVPATYGAALVAASEYALVLDEHEEAFVPVRQPPSAADLTIVTLDSKLVDLQGRRDAILAAMAFVLDQHQQAHPTTNTLDDERLDRLIAALDEETPTDDSHLQLTQDLLHIGRSISYGIDDGNDRSIPIALIAALSPQIFPENTIPQVLASFAPAMYGHEHVGTWKHRAPTIATTESMEFLIQLLRANRALWNCVDVNDDRYRHVLKNHVLV
jgi:hypothetical protein